MKSLLVKELKLLSSYGILFFILAALYAALSNYIGAPGELDLELGTWRPMVLPTAIWLAPIVGLFFGLKQSFSEPLAGLGSFAIQRPISFARMFWTKAAVGIGLAIAVVGIPFLAQESWRIYSDRFPVPTHRSAAYIIAFLLLTVASWSSGSIAGSLNNRNVNSGISRTVSIFAIVFGYFFLNFTFVMAAILLVAAYGVYVSLGDSTRMGKVSFIALGIVSGASSLLFLAAMFASFYSASVLGHWQNTPEQEWHYTFDGSRFFRSDVVDGYQKSWHYLNGPIETTDGPMNDGEGGSLTPITNDSAVLVNHKSEASFFDQEKGDFKQYNIATGHLVSVFDRVGFHPPYSAFKVVPFSKVFDSEWGDDFAGTIVTSRSIYHIDYLGKTLSLIYTPPAGEKVERIFTCWFPKPSYEVLTDKRLIKVDLNGKTLYSWNCQLPGANVDTIAWEGGKAVVWLSVGSKDSGSKVAIVLVNGKETIRQSLRDRILVEPDVLKTFVNAITAATPVVCVYDAVTSHNGAEQANEYGSLKIAAFIALLSTIGMLFLARRLEWSAATLIAWIVIAVMFGVGASFAAFSLYEWPCRLTCRYCNRLRLVTKDVCVYCDQPWPLPAADGAEVFDRGAYAARSINADNLEVRQPDRQAADSLKVKEPISWTAALVVKEVKVLRMAVVNCLVYAGYMCLIGSGFLTGESVMAQPAQSLCASMFYIVFLYTAFLLAFFATREELTSFDASAFSAQRPVGVGPQALIKLVMGIAAYALISGFTLTFFYWHFIVPGHVPGPPPWGTWKSLLLACPLGFLFWFPVASGVDKSFRSISRSTVIAVFCVWAAILAHNAAQSSGYLAILILALFFVGTAVWGFVFGRGETALQPRLSRFTLGAVIVGALVGAVIFAESFELHIDSPLYWHTPQESVQMLRFSALSDDWYYDNNKKVLLCYDNVSRKMVGIVDGAGWRAISALPRDISPVEFGIPNFSTDIGANYDVVVGKQYAYVADLESRSTARIFAASPGEQIQKVTVLSGELPLVETTKRLVILQSLTVPQPLASFEKPDGLVGVEVDNVVISFAIRNKAGGADWDDFVQYYDVHRHSVPPGSKFHIDLNNPSSNVHYSYDIGAGGRIQFVKVTSLPVGRLRVAMRRGVVPLSFGLDGLYALLKGEAPFFVITGAAVPTVAGLLLTILISRLMGWSRDVQLKWTLASLVLGLYTPPLLIALYRLPFREFCQSCGKRRAVTNDYCEHCGAGWPEPQSNGFEIFEPKSVASQQESLVGL